jgi:hypothetical protein
MALIGRRSQTEHKERRRKEEKEQTLQAIVNLNPPPTNAQSLYVP